MAAKESGSFGSYYPIGTFGTTDNEMYSTTYDRMVRPEKFDKSDYPPGYAGHMHGVKFKFGYGSIAGDKVSHENAARFDPERHHGEPDDMLETRRPATAPQRPVITRTRSEPAAPKVSKRPRTAASAALQAHYFPRVVKEPRFMTMDDDKSVRTFPYFHPLKGGFGSQFPPHPPQMRGYSNKPGSAMSRYSETYRGRSGGASFDRPVTAPSGSGTGFNYVTGGGWWPKDGRKQAQGEFGISKAKSAQFLTTYNRVHGPSPTFHRNVLERTATPAV